MREGIDAQENVAVLAPASRLPHVLPFALRRSHDGLAVSHLGAPHIGRHAEFTHHAVHQDLQMQLAHARN